MGKIVLLILLVLSLTGCSSTRTSVYYTVSVDNELQTLSDGTSVYLYNDGTLIEERNMLSTEWKPCLYFVPTGEDYNLQEGSLCNYSGTLYDISNYREELLESGYSTLNYVADYKYIDTKLSNGTSEVRIIYFADGRIKIFKGGQE